MKEKQHSKKPIHRREKGPVVLNKDRRSGVEGTNDVSKRSKGVGFWKQGMCIRPDFRYTLAR